MTSCGSWRSMASSAAWAAGGGRDLVAAAAQQRRHGRQDAGLVVDDQDALGHGSTTPSPDAGCEPGRQSRTPRRAARGSRPRPGRLRQRAGRARWRGPFRFRRSSGARPHHDRTVRRAAPSRGAGGQDRRPGPPRAGPRCRSSPGLRSSRRSSTGQRSPAGGRCAEAVKTRIDLDRDFVVSFYPEAPSSQCGRGVAHTPLRRPPRRWSTSAGPGARRHRCVPCR